VQSKFYPSAAMYVVYGLFCLLGFASWWRIQSRATVEAPVAVAAVN
jgi:nicotinamide mononucleotide transporter